MSLLKLIKAPVKMFKKDVITFLIIRRHDLGVVDKKLRYIAVKPSASISLLRQKVWHLLDLPDYCEEIIVLKNADECEIPLTHMRKGNNPHHPYILEVWLPEKRRSLQGTMIIMGTGDAKCLTDDDYAAASVNEEKIQLELSEKNNLQMPTLNNTRLNLLHNMQNVTNIFPPQCKLSDISCKISTSSLFYKLHGRKSRDNFANILMKIQSDLNTLTSKLSNLENKIQL